MRIKTLPGLFFLVGALLLFHGTGLAQAYDAGVDGLLAQGVTQTTPPTTQSSNPTTLSTNPPSSGQITNPSSGFVLQNPLNVGSICGLIKKLLGAILALGIPIAMLFLVYSGFLFVIARGNPAKLETARKNLVHVVMGIAIFLGAWFLGQIIANTINAVNPGSVSGINSCN